MRKHHFILFLPCDRWEKILAKKPLFPRKYLDVGTTRKTS
jgi:hypothetical protein